MTGALLLLLLLLPPSAADATGVACAAGATSAAAPTAAAAAPLASQEHWGQEGAPDASVTPVLPSLYPCMVHGFVHAWFARFDVKDCRFYKEPLGPPTHIVCQPQFHRSPGLQQGEAQQEREKKEGGDRGQPPAPCQPIRHLRTCRLWGVIAGRIEQHLGPTGQCH